MTRLGGRLSSGVVWAYGSLTLIFLAAPMLIVAFASLDSSQFFQFPPQSLSLEWYKEVLTSQDWTSSIVLTLGIASATAVVSTLLGTAAGIAIGRMTPALRRIAYGIVVAPLVVPSIVLAVALYEVLLRAEAATKLDILGSIPGFVLADTVLTAPLVTLFVAAAVLNVDRNLEYASLSLGAGQWRTLGRVTVPLIVPSAVAGGLLSFLLSMDEVVISEFLVGPDRVPIAVRTFLEVQHGISPLVTATATLLMGFMSVVAIAGWYIIGRRVFSGGR